MGKETQRQGEGMTHCHEAGLCQVDSEAVWGARLTGQWVTSKPFPGCKGGCSPNPLPGALAVTGVLPPAQLLHLLSGAQAPQEN